MSGAVARQGASAYIQYMASLSIEIDGELQSRWEQLADKHGLDPRQQITDAIIKRLEELEDYFVVRDRVAEPYVAVPHDEMMRRLGLDGNAGQD